MLLSAAVTQEPSLIQQGVRTDGLTNIGQFRPIETNDKKNKFLKFCHTF